jgi:alpha-methylacyl-CoA racemase
MGPLKGKRFVEFAGLGPAPFAAMMLSDLGADIIRIERMPTPHVREKHVGEKATGGVESLSDGIMTRGRLSIALDLKSVEGHRVAMSLIGMADGILEGFRPGAMERLGLGPEICLEENPQLVYARITGWGQEGPFAQRAGHDLNYIALSGALSTFGRRGEPPVAPLNLLGDFAGGGLLAVTGILAALVSASSTGKGQVVDAAMLDGSAYLMTMMYELLGAGQWTEERESNPNDGAAHFYGVYETSDQRYVSIAAMEPQFYASLLNQLGLTDVELPEQWDVISWPAMRILFEDIFRSRTRHDWCESLADLDTCFAPVLTMSEAPHHPHNAARSVFTEVDATMLPSPVPRFSATPLEMGRNLPVSETSTDAVLALAGLGSSEIAELRAQGVIL